MALDVERVVGRLLATVRKYHQLRLVPSRRLQPDAREQLGRQQLGRLCEARAEAADGRGFAGVVAIARVTLGARVGDVGVRFTGLPPRSGSPLLTQSQPGRPVPFSAGVGPSRGRFLDRCRRGNRSRGGSEPSIAVHGAWQ